MIRLSETEHGPQKLEQLYEILRGYPGKAELQILFQLADGSRVSCKCTDVSVAIDAEMRSRVDNLLGSRLPAGCCTASPATGGRGGNGRGRR